MSPTFVLAFVCPHPFSRRRPSSVFFGSGHTTFDSRQCSPEKYAVKFSSTHLFMPSWSMASVHYVAKPDIMPWRGASLARYCAPEDVCMLFMYTYMFACGDILAKTIISQKTVYLTDVYSCRFSTRTWQNPRDQTHISWSVRWCLVESR